MKTIVVASDKGSLPPESLHQTMRAGWALAVACLCQKQRPRRGFDHGCRGARRPRHDPPQLLSWWPNHIHCCADGRGTATEDASSAPRCLGPQVAAPLAARETGEGAQLRLCFQGGAPPHIRALRVVAYGNGKRLPCSNALVWYSAGNRHAMNCTDPF